MKITYDYVKDYVELQGYTLVSKEYVRSGERLGMICDKGHECSISWDNFKYGRRCRSCADENKASKFKFKYNEVKSYIESFGCELLDDSYKNNTQKLQIRCSCGNIYKITYQRFREDGKYTRCYECRDRKSKKHSIEYVRSYVESQGYRLISDEYISADTKLKLKCENNHDYNVSFANFQYGKRCPKCQGKFKLSIDEVRELFAKEGYTLLENEYKNTRQRLNIICNQGHITTITVGDFKAGCRCNICRTSKGERVIREYLSRNKIDGIYNQPYFDDLLGIGGNPLRPDFILPEHKIWIEYDGEFHYRKVYDGDGHEKLKIHDKLKNKYAKKHNWKMIRIPYWEFDNIENILNREII